MLQGNRIGDQNAIHIGRNTWWTEAVRFKEDGTPMWGSRVLIGTNIVLTAAHNVYNDEKPFRKRYSHIKFIPGANEDEAPFGEIEVDQVFAPEEYINHKEVDDDENGMSSANYALLILKKPIGHEFRVAFSVALR